MSRGYIKDEVTYLLVGTKGWCNPGDEKGTKVMTFTILLRLPLETSH
jgi:hypothetical protein